MIEQAAFEHDGHARPNILASKIAALTLVSAFAITGCSNGERSNDSGPDIEQISESNGIDISGLDEEGKSLFSQIEASAKHNGTLADFSSTAEYNQSLFGGANSEQFNNLTVEINGRDVNCGVAENIWFLSDEMPKGFESADFDPTQYERACTGSMSRFDLALFVPYVIEVKETIEKDTVLDKMQPELAAGLIQQTGHELLIAEQNSDTLEGIVNDVAYVAETWSGSGYVPNQNEVADIVETAMKDVYGLPVEVLSEGNAAPDPVETEPAAEPQPEPAAPGKLEVPVDPGAVYPLTYVQDTFAQATLSGAETMTYYSAAEDSFLNCGEYLKIENCSDAQISALYAAANASDALYGLGVESPADLQALTIYNVLLQANDPALQTKGGLKTYTLDLLTADVESQLHREVASTEIADVANSTLKLLGISLSGN